MLCHRLGQLLDYIGARGVSLMEHLDNAPCHVHDIADFNVHRGEVVALLMVEVCTAATFRISLVPFVPLG
jgi:hypothetical protein